LTRSTRRWAGNRSRRSGCCGRCCCRRSTGIVKLAGPPGSRQSAWRGNRVRPLLRLPLLGRGHAAAGEAHHRLEEPQKASRLEHRLSRSRHPAGRLSVHSIRLPAAAAGELAQPLPDHRRNDGGAVLRPCDVRPPQRRRCPGLAGRNAVAASYPIQEIETLSESDDQVDLAAILVPTMAAHAELDQVVPPGTLAAGALGYLDRGHHGVSATLIRLSRGSRLTLREPGSGRTPASLPRHGAPCRPRRLPQPVWGHIRQEEPGPHHPIP